MSRSIVVTSILVCLGLAVFAGSWAEEQRKGAVSGDVPRKPSGLPTATMMNINRIAAWYQSNGQQERIPATGNSGLYYPRGTTTAVYASGLMWGGIFNDGRTPAQRVNGYSYSTGTVPGKILGVDPANWAEDPDAADVRIWRIRRDYSNADLKQDAAEINSVAIGSVTQSQIDDVREQYATDWAEWPWQKGAPFYDTGYLAANGTDTVGANNGVLDRGEDANANAILDEGEDANGNGVLDGERPGVADADQLLWTVYNDIGATPPWNAPESGLEIQFTAWGYARTDALGNVIFKKWRIIYKGTPVTPANATIEGMYLCQWSDVDLGDSGDDFAGCDTTLSLGFTYNGKPVDTQYDDFDLPPPASGYDFLQGPMVPGVAGQDINRNGVDDAQDFAIFDLKRRGPGFVNLPLTSFIYFAAGGRYEDPPFSSSGGIRWYQMFRGLPPDPLGPPDPPPLADPVTRQPTTFWLSGDPVRGTGWLDGTIDNPGDRRILLNSGPFTMAVGDTQELVSAYVGGLGTSATGSISVMKFNDRSVQAAYDAFFELAKAPIAPRVFPTALDKEILLDWESDASAVQKTEGPVYLGGYAFEGYNIYQLPSPSADLSTAQKLATYDIANGVTTIFQELFDPVSGEVVNFPAQLGRDSGIRRYYNVTQDAIRGGPLVNGQPYYFAVTAYNYTPDASKPTRTLECPLTIVTVIPQSPPPGTVFSYSTGDTVSGVTNVVGANDAGIFPVINNVDRPAGVTYHVNFDTTSAGDLIWDLVNTSTAAVLVNDATDFSGTVEYRIPESGFSLYVSSPASGLKSVTDPQGADLFGEGTTSPTIGVFGSTEGDLQAIAGLGSNTNKNYELRFDGVGSYAVRLPGGGVAIGVRWVPFTIWDLGRSSDDTPKQVIASWRDDGTTDREGWNVRPDTLTWGSVTAFPFEAVYLTAVAYPNTGTPAGDSAAVAATPVRNSVFQASSSPTNPNSAIYSAFIGRVDGSKDLPPQGTRILFNKRLEIRPGDVKAFVPNAVQRDNVEAAKEQVRDIKVFPNPYYGVNPMETTSSARFVTFNHLPYDVKIRIFNIAGTLVRTLEKRNTEQFFQWDLQNYNALPVASGIYIAYLELKDQGGNDLGTKILKIAIIQEQQFLPYY